MGELFENLAWDLFQIPGCGGMGLQASNLLLRDAGPTQQAIRILPVPLFWLLVVWRFYTVSMPGELQGPV